MGVNTKIVVNGCNQFHCAQSFRAMVVVWEFVTWNHYPKIYDLNPVQCIGVIVHPSPFLLSQHHSKTSLQFRWNPACPSCVVSSGKNNEEAPRKQDMYEIRVPNL
jgi:hypothetical protein